MEYRYVDMENYKRRSHFAYFSGLNYPYVGVTAQVDITAFLAALKGAGLPFFLPLLYCASRAANRVPQLRQRILEGKIVEFSHCKTSHTLALEDGTFCYCTLADDLPFPAYLPYAQHAQEAAKAERRTADNPEEALGLFFVTSLPWLSYTAFVQPVPLPADSNPRISWGKYARQGEAVLLPVSLLCHHALVDGIHLAAFYRALEEELAALAAQIQRGEGPC